MPMNDEQSVGGDDEAYHTSAPNPCRRAFLPGEPGFPNLRVGAARCPAHGEDRPFEGMPRGGRKGPSL